MAQADRTLEGYGRNTPPPVRLGGALAAGTAFSPSETNKVRLGVEGLTQVRVRAKLSAAPTGTLTVTVYPMLSDAGADDTAGTRGASLGSAALTTADESVIDVTLRGETYIEVEGVMSAGLGDTATLAYIEATGIAG